MTVLQLDRGKAEPLAEALRRLPPWSWARLSDATFAERVRSKYRDAAQHWSPIANLVLCGPTGVGKTAAAIATCKRLAFEALKDDALYKAILGLRWVDSSELALARREHPLGHGEAPLVRMASHCPLLVLDDLGNELDTPEGRDSIWRVLAERYAHQRVSIITVGLSPRAARARYGDALWRRMTERGDVIS